MSFLRLEYENRTSTVQFSSRGKPRLVQRRGSVCPSATADLETPQCKVRVSYLFKQDGETLTCTWQAAQSLTVQISEGKVTGDKVSFVVKVDPKGGIVFAHEGKISGDEIQLTMKPSGEFPGSKVTARRVK